MSGIIFPYDLMTPLLWYFLTLVCSVTVDPTTIWANCSGFALHAGTAVSFDGGLTTVYTGDVGVAPGTAVTGSYSLQTGALQANSALAILCAASKLDTFAQLTNLTCDQANTRAASDLSGLTLLPGVWCSASGFFVFSAATLTLDAAGDANAVWVFQTGMPSIFSFSFSFLVSVFNVSARFFYVFRFRFSVLELNWF
jgi:hypothetical protein